MWEIPPEQMTQFLPQNKWHGQRKTRGTCGSFWEKDCDLEPGVDADWDVPCTARLSCCCGWRQSRNLHVSQCQSMGKELFDG